MEEITLRQRTPIEPLRHRGLISYNSRIIMLGSCFAESVGTRLESKMMDVSVNPFGPIYNPASMARSILRLLSGQPYTASELFNADGLWHSPDHHSRFSSADIDDALSRINRALADGHEAALNADIAVLTLGTSWIFTDITSHNVVNNCHKLPASRFERRMLSASESARLLSYALRRWRAERPELRIIFTVSPIRHLADGLSGNSLSKASLRVAVDELAGSLGAETAIYFPAYEIMLDDLRDYRYYAADMKHPSEVAVDYIERVFAASFMDELTMQTADSCQKLANLINHRPIISTAEDADRLRQQADRLLSSITSNFPSLSKRLSKITNL